MSLFLLDALHAKVSVLVFSVDVDHLSVGDSQTSSSRPL